MRSREGMLKIFWLHFITNLAFAVTYKDSQYLRIWHFDFQIIYIILSLVPHFGILAFGYFIVSERRLTLI